MMTIGNRIRLRRQELEMTQEDLAIKVGYRSRAAINKIELDGRQLRTSKIEAFARALNTTPAYLMGWDEPDPLPADLMDKLLSLDQVDRVKLEAYVDGLLDADKYRKKITAV